MRRLITGISWPLSGSLTGQIRLLLMLSAALLGFFWLLDYLASLVSTAPRDILASSPNPEEFKGVPTGVALLEFSAFAVSVVLAAVVLITSLGWPVARSSFRLSPAFVLGTLSSAAILAGGAYLAFSGVLERRLSYDRHVVEGSLLESGALVALAAIFFSLAIAGVVNRRSLVAVLVVWLVIGLAFGFLNPRSLDGLDLFERTIRPQESAAFASVVEKYMRTRETPGDETTPGTSSQSGTDPLDGAAPKDATSISSGKGLPSPGDEGIRQPVFRVAGAAHTRYLRVATGDVYENGEWLQLDSQSLPVGPGVAVEDEIEAMIQRLDVQNPDLATTGGLSPALLGSPLVTPSSVETNAIRVFPLEDAGAIEAGVVPISRYPASIDTAGSYDPFSATLTVPGRISEYEWSSSVPQFTLADLVGAEASTDEAYLQLPDDLPERIRQVAEQFRVSKSPFLNANQIMLFMEEELTYLSSEFEGEQPPEGSDPVEWLLFDNRAGDDVSYSSAFVVLARAAGIPARVVSGWVIEELEGVQIVYAQQFHHWAEIALEDVGWVTFDPASRASRLGEVEKINLDFAVELLTGSEEPEDRIEAAEAMGEIGGEEVLPWLVEAVENDLNEDVRQASMVALQKLDFDMLVWILLNHQDPEMRTAAASALNALRDVRAVQPFLQALSRDEYAPVRVKVADGLAHIGKNRAEGGLLLAATADVDASVREAAVRSLGIINTAWTARQLVSILGSDPDSPVRSATATALGRIRADVALRPLIVARSEDEAESIRQAAGDALTQWSSPHLVSILEGSRLAVERAAASQLLGEREFTDAIPALSIALYDPNEEVRSAALTALGSMGELTWLENGLGLLTRTGGYFALIPGTTAETAMETPGAPVFELKGGSNTNLLRAAVGDYYVDGVWLSKDQLSSFLGDAGTGASGADVRRTVDAADVYRDRLSVSPIRGSGAILPGSAPTSYRLESISDLGTYWPNSATFVITDTSSSYEWVSEIHDFSPADLNSADQWPTSPNYPYAELQDRPWLERARDLATEITSGQSTTYGQAKAIEQYLQSEYTYRFADPGATSLPPPGRDPVDWFLFESREGTSGSFSSAFVILARLVGIPARVVSGWAITVGTESQFVCSDQAHQWAEVAFDGPGWVTFDSTPGGAPLRADIYEYNPIRGEAASEEQGCGVTRLENGSLLLNRDGQLDFIAGTTTQQSSGIPHIPVFDVSGAANTRYLRTAVGDLYQGGSWRQLDPVTILYTAGFSVPNTVRSLHSSRSGQFSSLPDFRLETESLFGFIEDTGSSYRNRISISPAGEYTKLASGPVPTSLHLQSADREGEVYPFSSTFYTSASMSDLSWISEIPRYSEAQYAAAAATSDPTYAQLPEDLPERIRDLALSITSGHDTTYAKAKAIEQYLKSNYTYKFADSSDDHPPSGRDPADWFLFDHQEGTCGVFSSAFAVLARSVGIPARVVSGWAISATDDAQTVYLDQAHQWSEVAFEGLGWVTFEPTGSGGAPDRAGMANGDGADSAQDDPWAALDNSDPAVRESALEKLEEQGAEVIRLENGAAVIRKDGKLTFFPGGTTRQATKPPHIPVFTVEGAANTNYLRTSVGDVYEGGHWRRLDPVSVPYAAGESVPATVGDQQASPSSQFASLPAYRRETDSLFGLFEGSDSTYEDRIRIKPAGEYTEIAAGLAPTSLHLQSADRGGAIYPFSSTFYTSGSAETHSWTAKIPTYTTAQHAAAVVASDPTYTQLPEDLPERIRELALSITAGYSTTYAKAKAIEGYLKSNYTYRFADGTGRENPPPGRDPMDWFLFNHREGTCGVFSSAFAVLARSVGIPARVVSGWAIRATEGVQTVFLIQGHQWAEVPFEGIGWVTFEPTASGGAPSRAAELGEDTVEVDTDDTGAGGTRDVPPPPKDTFTTITQWPSEVRRQKPFVVGGNVTTEDGENVVGLLVDIFVNETKEHGGTWVGGGMTTANGYQAEVTLPANVELGDYQLLARAVGNDQYNESWSDPDITVYSGSGLELTGPSEITVDVEATFRGRLSEDTGQALPGRELVVTVDGTVAPSVMTDESGQFAFSRTFTTAGAHWVEVEVEDTEFVLDSTARLTFQVTLPTETVLRAPALVDVGKEFTVTGELRDVRGAPLVREDVYVQVGDGQEQTVATNHLGYFEFSHTLYEAGEFTARATFRRNGSVLSSNGTARLSSQHGVVLTIDGPGLIEQGEGATFVGRLESETATPTGELELTIKNSLERDTFSVTTDRNGGFEYHHASFEQTGLHSLTGSFAGGGSLGSSTAGISFRVAAPTLLTLRGPKGVRDGESIELTGSLLQRNGRAVPDAEITVAGEEPLTLVTDAEGRFTWEVIAELDRIASEQSGESELFIEVDFPGTDHLGPSSASLGVAVGLPRIVVEVLEPVARGDMTVLRGTVLVGSIPLADVPVTIDEDHSLRSNELGAFTYDYHVSTSLPLGTSEIVVSAEEIGASVTVPVVIMSAPSLMFEQAEESVPGEETLLSATLLDDKGAGIPQAVLSSSQGVEAVTDDQGVALFEVAVPESEEPVLVPLTFTFEGDSRHMPHSESFVLAVQPVPRGFNWLLWVGLPALLAVTVAATLARRRLMALPESVVVGRLRSRTEPTADSIELPGDDEGVEDQDVEVRQEANLEIDFVKAATDLPDIWGTGEDVLATVSLTDLEGQALAGATVTVSHGTADEHSKLVTGERGRCDVSWTFSAPGEYWVSADFEGDDIHLPASSTHIFRIVDFREEIVSLYNVFLEWADARVAGITEQSTPREVELMLVSEGVPVDQKSLDELISRFEEADYSEHPISRRHYEAMYRAWRTVLGA